MKHEVGAIAELPRIEENKPRRARRMSGGSGSNGGKGNGKRGGGDNNNRNNDNRMEEEQFIPSKYRLTMWIILLVIMMTFAGLVSAYIFIAVSKQQEWQPFDLPIQVFVSTTLILSSSATYELARVAIRHENQIAFRRWLVATAALGAMFIASQLLTWLALVRSGVYISSNPYAGFFYVLTAMHAVHLVGGIIALGYLILRAWNTTKNPDRIFKRQSAASVVGMYWHSMDGLWLVLLALLAFWK